jgi:hypothetical protein
MAAKDASRMSSLDISARSKESDFPQGSFGPDPEEGVRLLRAFLSIPQAALREAVIELAAKFAASADK